jgi:hypothetical protein
MENGKKPASPIVNSEGIVTHQSKLEKATQQQLLSGLDKREHFAGLAMQGFASNTEWSKELTADDWNDYVVRLTQGSVEVADALLAELEKTEKS